MRSAWYTHVVLPFAFLLTLAGVAIGNDYYTHGGYPATGSVASSTLMRAELDSITAGFDKLPTFAGNANKAVILNGGATALTVTAGTMALTGNLSISGNFSTTGAFNTTLVQGATTTLTLPTSNGTLATLAGSETLTTKTINLSSNTLTGTTAQFNTALSDNDFATLAGAESLSNKTLPSPTITGTVAGGATYTSPTLNTATVASPTFSGTASGSLTSLAVTNGVFTTSTVAADPSAALGVASKQYVDNGTSSLASGNPIINGSMEVWQRGTTFVISSSQQYQADRFSWNYSNTGNFTINRSTNVPTVAQAGVLFNYSYEVDVTTADASFAAGEHAGIWHTLEGGDWRHFAQRDFVVSFWVMSSKTGTHSVGFFNTAPDRGYVATYTINSADTWEQKSVTVSASPSAGTWNYTTGKGLTVAFSLGCGSTYQITSGSWQTISSAALCTSATVNDIDNAANFFRITGIKLELGSTATKLQFRPFQDELLLCKRYYQKSFNYATTPAQNVGLNTGELTINSPIAGAVGFSYEHRYPVATRIATPNSFVIYNPAAANAQMRNQTDSTDLTSTNTSFFSEHSFRINSTGTAGTAVGELLSIHWAVDAEL